MPILSEISDEPRYTIKTVSARTGIRSVTLRAWERRYEVLTPQRMDNRYRQYSERDIEILRWLKNRVDSGVPISLAANELRRMVKTGEWAEVLPAGVVPQGGRAAQPPHTYAGLLYRALIKHDEGRAGELLQEVLSSFSLITAFSEVLTPCLVEVGEAWYRGAIRITTEHFASALLRGRLLTLLQAYPMGRRAPNILIGGAPGEQHEIGALMVSVLLRSEGYRVEYLGPDIPLDDLADYAKNEKPQMIILSATTEPAALELRSMQALLSRLRPAPTFAYGGRAFNLRQELRNQIPGIFLGETLVEAVDRVKGLLGNKGG
jgi:methanogenic corrinoid protein MtbC1